MIFRQYYAPHLAQASYLVGDEATGIAAVVDPHEDVNWFLAEAVRLGLRIKHLLLTHLHPGFLANQIRLCERTQAEMYLGSHADADYPFLPVKDGDVLEFGSVRIKILDAPGHSLDSILILLYDLKRDPRNPVSVLAGDTLLVDDVFGTDSPSLRWSRRAEELAGMLYDSLHGKLLALPDDTTIHPAHASGKQGRGQRSPSLVSTIAQQRNSNHALQAMTRKEFIRMVTGGRPRRANSVRKFPRARLQPASLDAVLELKDQGSPVLDVRGPLQFAAAHVGGSLHIPMSGAFGRWFKILFGTGSRLSVVAEPGAENEVELMLGQVRPEAMFFCLEGGMRALAARPDLVNQLERITCPTLIERMTSLTRPLLLDVRTEEEWVETRIAGSVNIPLERLPERLHEVPEDREIVVYCGDGYRSSIAASLMIRHGRISVASLFGGLRACVSVNPRLLVSRCREPHRARRGCNAG